MNVRDARERDAAAIARVHTEAWKQAYRGLIADEVIADRAARRYWDWTARLAGKRAQEHIVVAELAGEIVGFAIGGPSPDKDMNSTLTAEVRGLYVHPDRWRRGAGRALLAHLLHRLGRDGFWSATLWVLADNLRARRFYEKRGWSVDGGERRHPERRALEIRYRLDSLEATAAAPRRVEPT